ncbi:MAG: hypothetical protein HYZ54_11845 [Ignavibacteriae bacterium]|nr:hypothetical protein [Ignavibacteriota bacterium]
MKKTFIMIAVLFICLMSANTTLLANAHLTYTIVKQPVCGCDGEVEIVVEECGTYNFIGTNWWVLKSNTNQLNNSSLGTPPWDVSPQFETYVQASGNQDNKNGLHFTIHNLCAGDWYFKFAYNVIDDNTLKFFVGDGTSAALHVQLTGSAELLNCDVSLANCGCYYKMATPVVSGGTPAYSYEWIDVVTNQPVNPLKLKSGTYRMTVTDANGCKCIKEFTVTTEAALPDVTLKITPKGCNTATADGGCVELTGSGLTGKAIVWKRTFPTPETFGPTGNATQWCNLQPGDKGWVRIVDLNNACVLELPWEIPAYTPMTFSLLTTSTVVNGVCYGRVDVANLAGGEAPYTYTWSPDIHTTPTTSFRALPATFSVTVTDKNGCVKTQQVTMLGCPTVRGGISVSPNPWQSNAVVAYDVTVNGNYSYKLYDGNLSEVRSVVLGSLTPGSYTTTVDGTGLLAGGYYMFIIQDGIPDNTGIYLLKE